MAPRNRRWKQLNVAREVLKRNRHKPSEVGSDDDALDVLSVSGDEQDSNLIDRVEKSFLQCKAGAGTHLRVSYTGSIRTTRWRKKKGSKGENIVSVQRSKDHPAFSPCRSGNPE